MASRGDRRIPQLCAKESELASREARQAKKDVGRGKLSLVEREGGSERKNTALQ